MFSVWGKTCCSECLNMPDDFYGFDIFMNNDSVWLEETDNFFKMIWNYFSAASIPSFFASSLPICKERWPPPRPHLRNGMKDMAVTWCKGEVNAGNL
jgi:hypothetical protein